MLNVFWNLFFFYLKKLILKKQEMKWNKKETIKKKSQKSECVS